MDILALKERKARLIEQAHEVIDTVERDHGGIWPPDLDEKHGRIWDEIRSLDTSIQRAEQVERAERELATPGPMPARRLDQQTETPLEARTAREQRQAEEYAEAFRRYLATGQEQRALQMSTNETGGYVVAPEQFVTQLIKAVDDAVYVRQWATVMTLTGAESLGVPSLDADPADADWTSELAIGGEDSSMTFGKRSLTPHPLAKLIRISRKLAKATAIDIDSLVRDRLAYKFAVAFEKACLAGSGVNQPLGLFTASTHGISTARDVSSGNTATALTLDGLKSAKWALKPAYWSAARWLFHTDAVAAIDKLKDNDGRYQLQPDVRSPSGMSLFGFPLFMSAYAPNTFAASQYVGILGDFRYYWIVDALDMTVQVLQELYAATNQVGYIGRLESDGMPVLEEAFVRVQLAAV